MNLLDYKDYIVQLIESILHSGLWIFIPTQAMVYIFGRMLGILKTDRTKNTLALITSMTFSGAYVHLNIPYDTTIQFVWFWVHWLSWGILWYVLIGFKLANRMDHLLDKKFADDEDEVEKTKKRKGKK